MLSDAIFTIAHFLLLLILLWFLAIVVKSIVYLSPDSDEETYDKMNKCLLIAFIACSDMVWSVMRFLCNG